MKTYQDYKEKFGEYRLAYMFCLHEMCMLFSSAIQTKYPEMIEIDMAHGIDDLKLFPFFILEYKEYLLGDFLIGFEGKPQYFEGDKGFEKLLEELYSQYELDFRRIFSINLLLLTLCSLFSKDDNLTEIDKTLRTLEVELKYFNDETIHYGEIVYNNKMSLDDAVREFELLGMKHIINIVGDIKA